MEILVANTGLETEFKLHESLMKFRRAIFSTTTTTALTTTSESRGILNDSSARRYSSFLRSKFLTIYNACFKVVILLNFPACD